MLLLSWAFADAAQVSPVLGDQPAMPSQQRARCHYPMEPLGQQPRESGQQCPAGPSPISAGRPDDAGRRPHATAPKPCLPLGQGCSSSSSPTRSASLGYGTPEAPASRKVGAVPDLRLRFRSDASVQYWAAWSAAEQAGYLSVMAKHTPMDDAAKARIMSAAARHPDSDNGVPGRLRPASAVGRRPER
jgi:hypothetical protein